MSAPAYAGLGTGPSATTAPVEDLFDDPKLMREMGSSRVAVGGAPHVGHATAAPTPAPMVASATMTRVASPRTAVSGAPAHPGASVPTKPVAVPAPIAAVPAPPVSPTPVALAAPARATVHAPLAAAPAHTPSPVATEPTAAPVPEHSLPPKKLALADTGSVTDAAAVDIAQTHRAPVEEAPAHPESSSGPWPYAPRMKLGYRRFPFARAGSGAAPSITPGILDPNRPESFESLSLDLYPVSWYMRMGLSTQFGWESGQFDRSGDYFFAESLSFGFQLPGRFTPFAEGLAGAGYMRRIQGTNSLPGGYWQLGVDVGVEIYFAARAYVSVAGGYLRPGNLFVADQNLQSIKLDTWSLKIGLGI